MNDDDTPEPSQTPQEAALIAAHAQRAAELRIQIDLLLLRSMAREIEQQQA